MYMRIEKKILPKYFDLILEGKKKYELRLNDFEVNEGDTLLLREHDGKDYTGRNIEKTVTMNHKIDIKDLFWPEEEVMEKGLQIISFE